MSKRFTNHVFTTMDSVMAQMKFEEEHPGLMNKLLEYWGSMSASEMAKKLNHE